MKITNSEVIKSGEKELIDAINADLDWGAIEETFRKEHKLGIEEDVEYKRGDIIIFNNRVAYKLEFDVKVTLSVLLDREGNYLSVTSSIDLDKTQDENEEGLFEEDVKEPDELERDLAELHSAESPEDADITQPVSPSKPSRKRFSKIASQAKEMIAEINEGR